MMIINGTCLWRFSYSTQWSYHYFYIGVMIKNLAFLLRNYVPSIFRFSCFFLYIINALFCNFDRSNRLNADCQE